jgi:putative ABC transport system permease protein
MNAIPPRLATRLLQRRLPDSVREFLLGDLEEQFHRLREADGEGRARRWYWGQALAALLRPWPRSPEPARRSWLSGWSRDLRYAFRTTRRTPLFSATVVLTFAIGLGASAAIFSVIDPVLLQGAPYPGADRVLLVWGRDPDGSESRIGYPTFTDVERESRTLQSSAAVAYWTPILRGTDASERLMGQRVTHRFFETLGVRPALGRDFLPEEDHPTTRNVAILSYRLWQTRFGGDRAIVGKTIMLSDQSVTVVGVMPADFESVLAPTAELWAPLGYEGERPPACRDCQHLSLVARLKEGTSLAAASQELDQISAEMVRQHPTEYAAPGFLLTPLNGYLTRGVRPVLLASGAAVLFLLLIACVNVMNLFLGRAARRTGEFAVRTALGAERGQLVRQIVIEAVVLSLAGGAVALALAFAAVRALLSLAPATIPRLDQVSVNLSVLGFTLLLATIAGIIAGLVPASAAFRTNLNTLLRQGGRSIARAGRRLRTTLVVAEVALATSLIVGAGLLVQSVGRVLAVNPGFEVDSLVSLELDPFGSRYDSREQLTTYFQTVMEAVAAVPGVTGVSATTQMPLSGDFDTWGVHLESHPSDNPEADPAAFRFGVMPGYLHAMGIPLLRGRDLTPADRADAPPVVLINAAMARTLFRDQDPLGQRVKLGGMDGPWRTIVGVTGNVRHQSLDAVDELEIYMPEPQAPFAESRMILVVRGGQAPASLVPGVRQAILAVDRSVPIATVATATELIQLRTATRRFALRVFQIFSCTALLLAALGLYGVLATGVAERFREIGIRSALGATRAILFRGVVSHALAISLAGMTAGLGGGVLLSGLLRSLLYGVTPTDPGAFAFAAGLLLAVALLAASVPAWRAAGADPVVALREE